MIKVTKPNGQSFTADYEEIDMMGGWAVIKMPGSLSDRRILIEDGWKVEEVKP